MESHVVYQPFKISPYDWQVEQNSIRQVNGKDLVTVIIGKKLVIDKDSGETLSEEPVKEDIWQDTLLGIFMEKNTYRVKVRPGRSPGLFITYGGEMLPHNDTLAKDMDKLVSYLETAEPSASIDAMIDGVLNDTTEKKYSQDTQKFFASVNRALDAQYPAELIIEALKMIYCVKKRSEALDDLKDMRFMPADELIAAAGNVLKGRLKGVFDDEYEAELLDELLYRFLSGRLREKL